MNTRNRGERANRGHTSLKLRALLCIALLANLPSALAEPRDALPPWPEQTLGIWSFNNGPIPMSASRFAVGADTAILAESWSGYALTRDAFTVSPVAIPPVDPYFHKTNFTTAQGTIRFWYCPNWSSAGVGGGGPGGYARLLELVSLGEKESETIYSLYLSPDGSQIFLSGQGVGGATDFLKADLNWRAGKWRLITLAYSEAQTALYVDWKLAATGIAMPDVPAWKQNALGLVVGSDIAAANPAQGQFDELCTFDYPLSADDVLWYWRGTRKVVALGPVGTEAEELAKQQGVALDSGMVAMSSSIPDLPPDDEPPPEEGDPIPPPEYTSPVYASNALWLSIEAVSNDVAYVTIHSTLSDTLYELLSKENLETNAAWQSEGLWLGAADTNLTPATVAVGWRTNKLFIWARSWADTTGSGLPDWWSLQYFGTNNVDGYADPDGDGWVNIQEWQNGSNPTNFSTPAAPQGLTITLGTNGATATLNWLPAPGSVTGYTVERALDIFEEWFGGEMFSVSAGTTTFADTAGDLPTGLVLYPPKYRIQAHYTSGDSFRSDWKSAIESLEPDAFALRNGNGTVTISAAAIPPSAASLRVGIWDYDDASGQLISLSEVDLPAENFSSGSVDLTAAQQSGLTNEFWYLQWVATNNARSMIRREWEEQIGRFWDGREQLGQNLSFLLRAAPLDDSFGYTYRVPWRSPYFIGTPSDYAYVGIRDVMTEPYALAAPAMTELPFTQNHTYRNFVFSPTNLLSDGWLNTGAIWDTVPILGFFDVCNG